VQGVLRSCRRKYPCRLAGKTGQGDHGSTGLKANGVFASDGNRRGALNHGPEEHSLYVGYRRRPSPSMFRRVAALEADLAC
jgi:hypothetical protein